MEYSGSDWLKASLKVGDMSPLGEAAADFLGDLFLGIYHMNTTSLRKVDWTDPYYIRVTLPSGLSMATVDGNMLTKIVVLAHDRMLRVDILSVGPRYLALLIHQRHNRLREDGISRWCPTLEDHAAIIRKNYGTTETDKGA